MFWQLISIMESILKSKPYKGDKVQIKHDEDKLKKEVLSLVDEYQTISKEKQEEAVPKVSDPQIIISETFIKK